MGYVSAEETDDRDKVKIRELRTVASTVAVSIMGYCERNSIAVPVQCSFFDEICGLPEEAPTAKWEGKCDGDK